MKSAALRMPVLFTRISTYQALPSQVNLRTLPERPAHTHGTSTAAARTVFGVVRTSPVDAFGLFCRHCSLPGLRVLYYSMRHSTNTK